MTAIYIGLPAYNEELAIPGLISKLNQLRTTLKAVNSSLHIILNNDGSTDQTSAVARALSQKLSLDLSIIEKGSNEGLGQGVRNIFDFFLKENLEDSLLVLMDADDTHLPSQVEQMLKKLITTDADIVIASRFLPGAESTGVPRFRVLTAKVAKLYLQVIFYRSGVTDFTCGYRMYTPSAVKRLKLSSNSYFHNDDFAAMPELILRAIRLKMSIAEIPLALRYDNKPTPSSMKVFKNSVEILILAIRTRFLPLK